MSEFLKWFKAQHGVRPYPSAGPDTKLMDTVKAGERAAMILRQRAEWDNRKESALYAWQARQPVETSKQRPQFAGFEQSAIDALTPTGEPPAPQSVKE